MVRTDQDRVRTLCLVNAVDFDEIELRTKVKDKPNGKWKIVLKDMLGFYPVGTEFYFSAEGIGQGCRLPRGQDMEGFDAES